MKRSTLIIIAFISAVLLPLRFVFAFYAYPSGVNTFAAGGVGDLSGNGMADLIAPLFLLSIFLNLMDSFSDNDGGSVILSGNSNNNNNNGGSSSYINQGTNNYNDGTSNYNAGTSNYNNIDYSGGGGYSTNVSPSTWDGGCASC